MDDQIKHVMIDERGNYYGNCVGPRLQKEKYDGICTMLARLNGWDINCRTVEKLNPGERGFYIHDCSGAWWELTHPFTRKSQIYWVGRSPLVATLLVIGEPRLMLPGEHRSDNLG